MKSIRNSIYLFSLGNTELQLSRLFANPYHHRIMYRNTAYSSNGICWGL